MNSTNKIWCSRYVQRFEFEWFHTQTNVDGNTQEPLPILSRVTRDWCREVANLPMADTVTDIINAVARGISCKDRNPEPNSYEYQCVRLVKAIDSAIARANQKAISGAQRVQKWSILPTDFSISGGELGITNHLKINQSIVAWNQEYFFFYSTSIVSSYKYNN